MCVSIYFVNLGAHMVSKAEEYVDLLKEIQESFPAIHEKQRIALKAFDAYKIWVSTKDPKDLEKMTKLATDLIILGKDVKQADLDAFPEVLDLKNKADDFSDAQEAIRAKHEGSSKLLQSMSSGDRAELFSQYMLKIKGIDVHDLPIPREELDALAQKFAEKSVTISEKMQDFMATLDDIHDDVKKSCKAFFEASDQYKLDSDKTIEFLEKKITAYQYPISNTMH